MSAEIASVVSRRKLTVLPLYVIGAGSRLFRDLRWPTSVTEVSGRARDLQDMPRFPPNATLLIFADPPSENETRAMILSVLGRLNPRAPNRIIFISSISAGFRDSRIFPHEGKYARRKRIAEEMLLSSTFADVSILRLGNVFSHGGWNVIRDNCRFAFLPSVARCVALSDIAMLKAVIYDVLAEEDRCSEVLQVYSLANCDEVFSKVIFSPLLLWFYKIKFSRFILRVAARIMIKFGIYIPSPDDLNSFLMAGRQEEV